MGFSDIVDAEFFFPDARNFNPMAEVLRETATTAAPHSATVQVLMSADMLVEIAMVARRDPQ
jgi:enamine deaminase RidA (YjgF/YER057c/UK114 family)